MTVKEWTSYLHPCWLYWQHRKFSPNTSNHALFKFQFLAISSSATAAAERELDRLVRATPYHHQRGSNWRGISDRINWPIRGSPGAARPITTSNCTKAWAPGAHRVCSAGRWVIVLRERNPGGCDGGWYSSWWYCHRRGHHWNRSIGGNRPNINSN